MFTGITHVCIGYRFAHLWPWIVTDGGSLAAFLARYPS